MKKRFSFVSNSSSASFIVGIPSADRSGVLRTLYEQLEYDFFGKYYLSEAIKKNIIYAKESIRDAEKEYNKLAKIPKDLRIKPNSPNYDPLEWAESTLKRWQRSLDGEAEQLKSLEEIDTNAEIELVEFGLGYHGIHFSPTYLKSEKAEEIIASNPHGLEQYDPDATDDSDLEDRSGFSSEEIIGYQLSDYVTMFNDFGDIPKTLRSITGILAFVYPDLKCWVEDDED